MCPHNAPDAREPKRTTPETKPGPVEEENRKAARLRNHAALNLVPRVGLEPTHLAAGDFESPASTDFATRAGMRSKLWHSDGTVPLIPKKKVP